MDKIRVNIDDRQKTVKMPTGMRMIVRRTCNAVLKMEQFEGPAEVNVIFVDNDMIHDINLKQRNKDIDTDVLSFPLGENGKYDVNPENGAKMLGDIVLSVEKAKTQAEIYGHSFQREVSYLTCHSMLHLLGYDHVNGGIEAMHMREKEETVMQQLGLTRDGGYNSEEEN